MLTCITFNLKSKVMQLDLVGKKLRTIESTNFQKVIGQKPFLLQLCYLVEKFSMTQATYCKIFNQKLILLLMPHSGPDFSIFWCVFMPKCSILAPPWGPAGLQMGPQITQVVPKGSKKAWALTPTGPPKKQTLSRSLSDRSWVPFWSIWAGFFTDCGLIFTNVDGFGDIDIIFLQIFCRILASFFYVAVFC